MTGDWSEFFDSIEVIRNEALDERPTHVVRLRKGELPSRTYWVDAETGDVLRVKNMGIEGSIRIPITVSYSEFQETRGIRSAMRVEIENPASGRTVLSFESAETGLELDDEVFTLVDPQAGEEAKD